MALIPNITIDSIAGDGTYVTVGDHTVYGTSNANRNTLAVFLAAYKVDEDQVESSLTITSFDPTTASTFQVYNSTDGYVKYYFIIAPLWLIGTTFNHYDLTYDVATTTFYQYTNSSSTSGNPVTDANYWTPIANPTTVIANIGTVTESLNINYQILGNIYSYFTAKCWATLVTQLAKEDCGCSDTKSGCGCHTKNGKAKKRIRTLLDVMVIANGRQQFIEGERAARQATKYCSDCGCLNQ